MGGLLCGKYERVQNESSTLMINVNAASYDVDGLGAMSRDHMIDDILRLLSNSISDK